MMWLRRFILSLPILLAAFFAVAFISVRASAPKRLNEFVSGSIGEPESLNPILSTTQAAFEIQASVFDSLLRYNENLELEGDLAKSWEIRQTSRWFFQSEAEAQTALQRVLDHRADWTAYSLQRAAREGAVVRLSFDGAGTSYREDMAKWLGDLKPQPVTFLSISLQTGRRFPDGAPAKADAARERILAALKQRPGDPSQRVIYTWTGGGSSYLEMPVCGPVDEVVSAINEFLNAKEEKAKLGSCDQGESAPSLDEPEIIFHLRPNVRWHDGQPFDSADALFTYQSLMSEEVASPRRSDFELVRELTTPDALTVRVLYKKPYSPALLSWGAIPMIPKHILAGHDTKWWAANFDRNPIGTGPFMFESWKSNEQIRLKRYADYWEGAPYVEANVTRFIPDPLALRLSFETGELDVYTHLEPFALGSMKTNPRYQIVSELVPQYNYIGWNLKRPLFQDRRVRQALAHAVNVPEIIRSIYYGEGAQCNGIFPPQMWFADSNIKPFAYDPKRAAELLAEAGWKDKDAEGWLVKDGKRFEFTLITNQANEMRKDIAILVQEDLKRLGIIVHVEIYEWAVFIKKIEAQDFDACGLGWVLGYDYDQYQLWHSSQAEPGRLNMCSYKNPRVDKLLELARSEFDRKRVLRYCHEIQRIIYEDQPYLFLNIPKDVTAFHRGAFRVCRPGPNGTWINEPIRSTKAGVGIYQTWWYRTEFPPKRLAPVASSR